MEESPDSAAVSYLAGQGIHPNFLKAEKFLCHKSRHKDFILGQFNLLAPELFFFYFSTPRI